MRSGAEKDSHSSFKAAWAFATASNLSPTCIQPINRIQHMSIVIQRGAADTYKIIIVRTESSLVSMALRAVLISSFPLLQPQQHKVPMSTLDQPPSHANARISDIERGSKRDGSVRGGKICMLRGAVF